MKLNAPFSSTSCLLSSVKLNHSSWTMETQDYVKREILLKKKKEEVYISCAANRVSSWSLFSLLTHLFLPMILSPLFYKQGKWGTDRVSDFLCVTWLLKAELGTESQLTASEAVPLSARLYFFLKAVEAVPAHKRLSSTSVEVAQNLSIMKYSV